MDLDKSAPVVKKKSLPQEPATLKTQPVASAEIPCKRKLLPGNGPDAPKQPLKRGRPPGSKNKPHKPHPPMTAPAPTQPPIPKPVEVVGVASNTEAEQESESESEQAAESEAESDAGSAAESESASDSAPVQPQAVVLPSVRVRFNANTTPAPPPEPEQESEYEMKLNPQLQEILEYMADDEKIYLVKGSQLNAVAHIMQMALGLKESVFELAKQLADLSRVQAQVRQAQTQVQAQSEVKVKVKVKSTNVGENEATSDAESVSPEDTAESTLFKSAPLRSGIGGVRINIPSLKTLTAPKAQSVSARTTSSTALKGRTSAKSLASARPPSKGGRSFAPLKPNSGRMALALKKKTREEGLVDMLEKYKKPTTDDDASSQVQTDIYVKNPADAGMFNTFFDAVYILNSTGKGVQLGEKLQSYGLTKCQIIEADIPPKKLPFHKILYYMRDAVENAKESGHSRVVILQDTVAPYFTFTREFSEMVDAFKNDASNWELIELGFTKHINAHRPTTLDWEYYSQANPSMELHSEKDAMKHWTRKGYREGRVGAMEIFQDDSLESIFAVAINSTIYDKLLKQIEVALNSKVEVSLVSNLKYNIYGVRPHLFINPDVIPDGANCKKAKQEFAKFQWFLPKYDIA